MSTTTLWTLVVGLIGLTVLLVLPLLAGRALARANAAAQMEERSTPAERLCKALRHVQAALSVGRNGSVARAEVDRLGETLLALGAEHDDAARLGPRMWRMWSDARD